MVRQLLAQKIPYFGKPVLHEPSRKRCQTWQSSDSDSDGTDRIPYRQSCVVEELAYRCSENVSAGSDLGEDFGNAAPNSLIVDFGSCCCEKHPHGAHHIRQFCRTVRYGRPAKDIVVASVACLEVAVDMEQLLVEYCYSEVPIPPTMVPVGVVE